MSDTMSDTATKIETSIASIRIKLNAPKDQYNEFGNFSYRSAESIYSSVKPLLESFFLSMFLNDEVVNIGGSNYVRSTCTVIDLDTNESRSVDAYAREQESKSGMDASQITGSASSYARKYAMCAMFLIDQGGDPDSQDNRSVTTARNTQTTPVTPPPRQQQPQQGRSSGGYSGQPLRDPGSPATDKQIGLINRLAKEKELNIDTAGLTKADASALIDKINSGEFDNIKDIFTQEEPPF